MKPAELMEAPAAAGPGSATPELIAHDWDVSGYCANPERVAVDFGKKGGNRKCVVLLGLCDDGTWRAGWDLTTKDGQGQSEPLARSGAEYPSRAAALRVAISQATQRFEGDRPAAQALGAMFAKTLPQPSGSPANNGDEPRNVATAQSRPLPDAAQSGAAPERFSGRQGAGVGGIDRLCRTAAADRRPQAPTR